MLQLGINQCKSCYRVNREDRTEQPKPLVNPPYCDNCNNNPALAARIMQLRLEETELRAQLAAIELELIAAESAILPPPPVFREINTTLPRRFDCHCGLSFPSYLERESHIDAMEVQGLYSGHYKDGEWLGDKKLVRDTTIVGEPVIKATKAPKGYNPDDNFDDL